MAEALSDQSTRDLVSRDGLDQTLFVEAGAGTGKTTQLVTRIVNTVLNRDVPLSAIAAITFTEAAASELQSRIRVEFEKQTLTDDPTHRERAEQAISDADLAAISTVHGFASRILAEFSVLAGLPPRVSVLDEVASQLEHERRWGRFVDILNDEPQFDELMYRAALIEVPLAPRYHGQASFKDVAYHFAQNWDRLADLVDTAATGELPPIDFGSFDRAVGALVAAVDFCTDPTDKLSEHLQQIIPEMRHAGAMADPHRKVRRFQALHRAGRADPKQKGRRIVWGRSSGGAKGKWSVDPNDVKDLIDDVSDALSGVLDAVSTGVLNQLMRLTATEVVNAASERKQNGGLEFHDLLVLARQVLRDKPEVRRALHERYRQILLDEFQDTDPIQIELASLIAATPSNEQPDRWQDHVVEGGRLFFVGDPKQSIYRFRRADIKLFLEARDAFSATDGGAVRLDTNFRTVPPIIDWINGLFSEAMPEEVAEAQPRYEPLHAGRELTSGVDHRPVVLGGEHPDPDVKAGPLRIAEAADVAAIINDIVAGPERWPVEDERTKQWRPARLSDITILIPTRTSLQFLRDALAEHEIPYRLATGTLVYDTQEVRDVLAVMRAVDDPGDTLSLIAALRSPLYGCSDVDLFVYHQANKRWNLRSVTPDGLNDEHPVVAALAHMRSLWEQRWWLSPATLLERVVRERRGFLLGYGTQRPTEVWRRLRFIIDQARAFEESNGGGLRSFLDWADLQSAEGSRVHEPMLPETDDEALQILTVHGSKGLEFPITILSGMTTKARGKQNGVSVLWNETGQPEVKLRSGVATTEHTARADIEEEMDAHEKLRLLYVAATRARDHLIVSGHHKASKKTDETSAGRLALFAAEHPELSRRFEAGDRPADEQRAQQQPERAAEQSPSNEAKPQSEPAGGAMAARSRWIADRQALLAPHDTPAAYSATAIARAVDASVPDSDTDDLSNESDSSPTIVRKKGRAGSAIGSAVHATIEYINFDDPADLDALVARQCELHAIPDAVDTVTALVRSALASNALDLARRHESFRELYVAAPLGDVMIEGYIDLLVQTPDGLVIIDWKTDSASSPKEIDAKLAAYELQGATYAVALEESTGIDVIDCRFVFCKASGAVERSVVDLAAAKQRVRDAVTAGIVLGDTAHSDDGAGGDHVGQGVPGPASTGAISQPRLFND
jgi:ATP-dependent helicase/nuclease subunit A